MKWGNWLIAACCALFVAVILTPTGLYSCLGGLAAGKDAAAWAQAFGALAAIGAAVSLPRIDARLARNRARRAGMMLAAGLVEAVRVMARLIDETVEPSPAGKARALEYSVQATVDAIDRFNAGAMDSARAWHELMRIRTAAENALLIARQIQAKGAEDIPGLKEALRTAIGACEDRLAKLDEVFTQGSN
jgi:hypothetical protein